MAFVRPRRAVVQIYLAAHDDFVAWLDQASEPFTSAEMDRRLYELALCAARRGMTGVHWTFAIDGLVAHVNRRFPGNVLLSSLVARGFDLAERWDMVRKAASVASDDVCSTQGG